MKFCNVICDSVDKKKRKKDAFESEAYLPWREGVTFETSSCNPFDLFDSQFTSSKSKSIDNTRFFYLKLQMHFDI